MSDTEYHLSSSSLLNRLARIGGYVALKRHLLLAAVVWAFCGVMIALCVAFGVAFDRRYGAIETIAAIMPQATVSGVVLVAAFTRKSLRPPNYPRIAYE